MAWPLCFSLSLGDDHASHAAGLERKIGPSCVHPGPASLQTANRGRSSMYTQLCASRATPSITAQDLSPRGFVPGTPGHGSGVSLSTYYVLVVVGARD